LSLLIQTLFKKGDHGLLVPLPIKGQLNTKHIPPSPPPPPVGKI